MEEIYLVRQAKQGDKEALVTLVMAQKEAYYKLAYVFLKEEEEAVDSLQEMIVILYENIGKLKDETAFYSWSKTILVNRCKQRLKEKKKIIYFSEPEEEVVCPNREQVMEADASDEKIVLENALEKLKPKHREVIILRYYLDLDYEAISKMLGVPLGTIKSRLSIGLRRLEKIIGGEKQ